VRGVAGVIASVHLDVEASAGEVEAVRESFRRYGLDPKVKANFIRRSAGPLPWIVEVTLLAPIAVFFAELSKRAANDAYDAAKAWVKEVWAARGGRDGALMLTDPEYTNLVLSTRIGPEALDALGDIDWDEVRGGYLLWDDEAGAWFDKSPGRSA
jgi:hypothetical protein